MSLTNQLTKIKQVHESVKVLSVNQVVYILGLMHNVEFEVNADDIKILTENGILVNNALHEDIKEAIQGILDTDTEEVKPIVTPGKFSETSQKVYDTLVQSFHTGISKPDMDKFKKFTGGDVVAAGVFYTFLSLMPSSSSTKNKKWDETFNTTYKGVTLRRLTTHTAKKFMNLYKKCDAGQLCLALFLFVKDGVKEDGKCFIKKIDTFFKEFNSWYEDAGEALNSKLGKIEEVQTEQSTGRRVI